MPQRRVVIIGAGITGLATARAILDGSPDTEVVILERAHRPGGNISTEHAEGFIIDGGPDSWVAAKPQATELACKVGLESELVGTIEANRRVYVAWEDGLHALPEGFVLGVPTELLPILRTPLFSWGAKLRMALEPFVPRHVANGQDESIASFVSRRLGREVSDRLVAPLLGGIYGGDATDLSIRATLPQFVDAESKHGSLVLAMRAQRRTARPGRGKPASAFVTLRGGIGGIVDRLARDLGGRLRTGVNVSSLSWARLHGAHDEGGVSRRVAVDLEGAPPIFADNVVLAIPPNAASRLLAAIEPRASELLGGIPHASTAVVFLAFRREDIARPLDATGYIVPRGLGSTTLAATWVSSKWDGRAPAGTVLLRVFLGGAGRDDIVTRDDAALLRMAKDEVRSRMGSVGEPILTRVFRFLHASPQPLLGHLDRIAEVNRRIAEYPGLYLAGSGYEGVGIPDCVRQARKVADAIVASVA
jgi:protoporphyrinogen/coproporphyrinogen III oxidase